MDNYGSAFFPYVPALHKCQALKKKVLYKMAQGFRLVSEIEGEMQNRNICLAMPAVLLALLFLAACAPRPAATTQTETAGTGSTARSGSATEAKLSDWDKTVAEAKREGRVIVNSAAAPVITQAIGQALADKYGIQMEVMVARSAVLLPKFRAEINAGIHSTDIMLAGISGAGFELAKDGALQRLDPEFLLPEVANPKLWYREELPFIDSNHSIMATQFIPKRPIAYNKDQVKPEQIGSYRDLLDPRWKGKMVFNDPTISGGGNTLFYALAKGIMSLDYLRQLGKQELVITRDTRMQVEWLARGKYPLLLGFKDAEAMDFITAGAPIMVMSPKAEPTMIISSTTVLHLFNKAPHPNAARLFINWYLSKEGQTVVSKASLGQSARLDVPTDHLPAFAIRQPGEKYFFTDTEESQSERVELTSVAKVMWGDLMK